MKSLIIPSPNYSWLEIIPTLLLLIIVAGFLAFAPTLDYIPFGRDKIDLENVINNLTLEIP